MPKSLPPISLVNKSPSAEYMLKLPEPLKVTSYAPASICLPTVCSPADNSLVFLFIKSFHFLAWATLATLAFFLSSSAFAFFSAACLASPFFCSSCVFVFVVVLCVLLFCPPACTIPPKITIANIPNHHFL
ncbi:hypothetical protein LAV44_04010 [Clostridium sporogenes]|nr:hypothetical protein [Clostridium sporogenes]MCW6074489.1 hypothetical protein [Clostridium sporogenes]